MWIEYSDFLHCGWKDDTVKKANLRNGSKWQMMANPDDKRKPLVKFDTLIDDHKEKIKKQFGNPYDYIAKEPIKKLVEKDFKAESFFMSFKIDDNKSLLPEHITKYTIAASWLNMLVKTTTEKSFIKKTLNLPLDSFWIHVCDLIKIEKVDLPTSYQRLNNKVKEYASKGYECLIDWRFGNKLAAKIDDKTSEDMLFSLLKHGNQYDDVMVCFIYNKWASTNGYKEVKPGIIGIKRKEWEPELTALREGWDSYNSKYIRQVKGLPANTMMPLKMVECDDYNLNYYYQNKEAKEETKYMQRYVSYIVADSSIGLVLGSCYRQAKAPVFEMIRIAWIDAMYYIKSLANDGNWYMPYEVKGDHWNKSAAFPFFKSIGKFVPPALKNKQGRGYIEQMFGSTHAERAEKMAAHKILNYNGHNITAKTRGVNIEALKANEKSRPKVGEEACEQIDNYFLYMRKMPSFTKSNMEAPSREALWLEKWNAMPAEEKIQVDDMQFLSIFGIPKGRTNKITNRGIEPVIAGVKYSYDLPNYVTMQHLIGSDITIVYDPYDMSRVLVTDFKNIRFIAKEATLQPRGLAYAYNGSRAALNMVLEEKKAQVERVSQLANDRQIDDDYLDVEALMFGGMMPKETLAMVEQKGLEYNKPATDDWEKAKLTYLETNTNFDEYL